MSPVDAKLAEFRNYCLLSGDRVSRAWRFADGPSSPALQESKVFSAPDSRMRIYLIDQYDGRMPALTNYTTLTEGPNVQLGLRPLVILDSNAISYIDGYVKGKLEPEVRATIREFISFLLVKHIDPSPVFYFIESLAKSNTSRWHDYASSFAQAHYTLQTLDRELFLKEGVLASSLALRASQNNYHGARDSGQLVESYVGSIRSDDAVVEAEKVSLSYAALLKIALMRLDPMTSLTDFYISLGEYMADQLGAVLGMERIVALFHWSDPGRFAKMIPPLQRGVSSDKFFRKVGSTAWDLRLGRYPEKLGEHIPKRGSTDAEAVFELYYIATAEDGLAQLLSQRAILLLIQHADSSRSSSVIGQKGNTFADIMDPEELETFLRNTGDQNQSFQQTAHMRIPLSGTDLDTLIDNLEDQVRTVCTS